MDDELEYLEEGFDPNKLTVSKLRNVLNKENVPYASATRKAALVDLFEEHITPQLPQLRVRYLQVQPSDLNIEHIPRTRTGRAASPTRATRARAESPAKEPAASPAKRGRPPKATPATRPVSRGRKAATPEPEEPEEPAEAELKVEPTPSRRRKAPASLGKVEHLAPPKVEEAEPEEEPHYHTRSRSKSPVRPISAAAALRSPRKRRAAAADIKEEVKEETADVKPEPKEPARRGRPSSRKKEAAAAPPTPDKEPVVKPESPFTQDNVFQSGSRKRTSEQLGKSTGSAERPHKVQARQSFAPAPVSNAAVFEPPVEQPAELEVDVMSEYTNFHESGDINDELPVGDAGLNELELEIDTDGGIPEDVVDQVAHALSDQIAEQLLSQSQDFRDIADAPAEAPRRRGFMPSLANLRTSNLFAQTLGSSSAAEPAAEPASSEPAPAPSSPLVEPETKPKKAKKTPAKTKKAAAAEKAAAEKAAAEAAEKAAEAENAEAEEDTEEAEEKQVTPEPVKKARRKHILVLAGHGALLLGWLLLGFVVSTLAVWWRAEQIKAGFCDVSLVPAAPEYPWFVTIPVSDPRLQTLQDSLAQGLDKIAPSCLPCPEHATCYEAGTLVCRDGYVPRQGPLSLLGLAAPHCVKDEERERKLRALAERAAWFLRQRAATALCSPELLEPHAGKPEHVGGELGEAALSEDELLLEVYKLKHSSISDEEFNSLWSLVVEQLPKLQKDIEMVIPSDYEGTNPYGVVVVPAPLFVSHSRAHVPLTCRLKLDIEGWVRARREAAVSSIADALPSKRSLLLALVTALVSASVGVAGRVYRARKNRVADAVEHILTLLVEQTRKADSDRAGTTPRYLPMRRLLQQYPREDHVAIDKQLEAHKSVRKRQLEIHGEITTIYELIDL